LAQRGAAADIGEENCDDLALLGRRRSDGNKGVAAPATELEPGRVLLTAVRTGHRVIFSHSRDRTELPRQAPRTEACVAGTMTHATCGPPRTPAGTSCMPCST